ncbi:MAG: Hsp20/alpha crystallin family protein [Candidatus Obscuribacterales bacterium]|nr:Hsp20/alpha crystallin family protein [Candidatus Obscuribacterales bacterium]
MTFSNLIPWTKKSTSINREEASHDDPVRFLHEDMNRLFDAFFFRYGTPFSAPEQFHNPLAPWSSATGTVPPNFPRIDVRDANNELRITAELPGLSENDVQVTFASDKLTISGNKQEEKLENEKGWYRMERQYGSFTRVIPVPCEIQSDQIDASFKNGILTVILPKAKAAKTSRTITVKKE